MKILQFKLKEQHTKLLTNGEVAKLKKRIDEINDIIDLCSDDDVDVLNNLEQELNNIIEIINGSIMETKKQGYI